MSSEKPELEKKIQWLSFLNSLYLKWAFSSKTASLIVNTQETINTILFLMKHKLIEEAETSDVNSSIFLTYHWKRIVEETVQNLNLSLWVKEFMEWHRRRVAIRALRISVFKKMGIPTK